MVVLPTVWQQFEEGPHLTVIVRHPESFDRIVNLQ